jgi:membrane associated rhomboid family serine protease
VDQAPEQQPEVIRTGEVEVLGSGGQQVEAGSSEEPQGKRSFLDTLKTLSQEAPVTLSLLALNILVYLVYNVRLGEPPVQWAYFPAGGQAFPQILTYMFVHGNFTHILVNSMVVFSFGVVVERIYGSLRYTIFYLLAGILAAYAQTIFVHDASLIGASGAASALIAVFVRFFPRERIYLLFMPMPAWIAALVIIGINVLGQVTGGVRGSFFLEPNIGYLPHLAGIAAGLIWSLAVKPTSDGLRFIEYIRTQPKQPKQG